VLQLENALNNFTGARRLLHLHRAIILRDYGLLFSEVADALEGEIRARRRDLHIKFLTERIHIATDLLDIRRRHVDDTGKVQARNLDILNICIEQFQEIVRRARLVRVLHTDAEFVWIGRRQIERQAVVVAHRLNQFEQVNHVHTENILCRAKICLKTVTVETQIDKDRMSLVD